MQITFKLFASLAAYLPDGAKDNAIRLELDEDMTITGTLDRYGVPRKMCHLVLVNGLFITPDERDNRTFADGDTLAVWPPIAGG